MPDQDDNESSASSSTSRDLNDKAGDISSIYEFSSPTYTSFTSFEFNFTTPSFALDGTKDQSGSPARQDETLSSSLTAFTYFPVNSSSLPPLAQTPSPSPVSAPQAPSVTGAPTPKSTAWTSEPQAEPQIPSLQSAAPPQAQLETAPAPDTVPSLERAQEVVVQPVPRAPSVKDETAAPKVETKAPRADAQSAAPPITQPAPAIVLEAPPQELSNEYCQDDNGATLYFGESGIYPHKIEYKDRSIAEFSYDESGNVIRLKDRDGTEWTRQTMPDHKNFARWASNSGDTCEMSLSVLPNGTWQGVNAFDNIQTFTTDGKILVWRPFPEGFDLKRTLFNIFNTIDKNKDATLSQEEIESASRRAWPDASASQLIALLKEHYESIARTRRHAMFKEGVGITIDEILAHDSWITAQQNKLKEPPRHAISILRSIFKEEDRQKNGVIGAHNVRRLYNEKFKRTPAERVIIEILHAALNSPDSDRNLAEKANSLTFEDVTESFAGEYRKQIGRKIQVGGWAVEEIWDDKQDTRRLLYANTEAIIECIDVQALRQSVPRSQFFMAALSSVVAHCPHVIVRMITDNNNGTYTIKFPGDPESPINVNMPSHDELSNFPSSGTYGAWPAIVLSAFQTYIRAKGAPKDLLPACDLKAADVPYPLLDLLTGVRGQWRLTKSMNVPELNQLLRDATRQRRAMLCASLTGAPRHKGRHHIQGNQVYSVLAYEQATTSVSLYNPNGGQSSDDSTSSAVQETFFKISLNDFAAAFDGLYLESWDPASEVLAR